MCSTHFETPLPLNETCSILTVSDITKVPSSLSAALEGTGFLDALNSAPVPGIKIKKKKGKEGRDPKAVSPTSNKVDRQTTPLSTT